MGVRADGPGTARLWPAPQPARRQRWRPVCAMMSTSCVHKERMLPMETARVGMREFRTKLAQYLLGAETPIAITRHGETIGFFIPVRPKRTAADRAALKDAAERFDRPLSDAGLAE